jgi:hypothetical protein
VLKIFTYTVDFLNFIVKELGQNDRADELKTAIVTLIRQTDHQGLIYKFKIDV